MILIIILIMGIHAKSASFLQAAFLSCVINYKIHTHDFVRDESKLDLALFSTLKKGGKGYLWGQASGLAGGLALAGFGLAGESALKGAWDQAALLAIPSSALVAAAHITLMKGCRSSKIMTLTTMPRRMLKTLGYAGLIYASLNL